MAKGKFVKVLWELPAKPGAPRGSYCCARDPTRNNAQCGRLIRYNDKVDLFVVCLWPLLSEPTVGGDEYPPQVEEA